MNEASNIVLLESDLERDPSDQDTRLILADLLDDVGDPLANTLRWMASNSCQPIYSVGKEFLWSRAGTPDNLSSGLPNDVIILMDGSMPCLDPNWRRFKTCKEATLELHKTLIVNS